MNFRSRTRVAAPEQYVNDEEMSTNNREVYECPEYASEIGTPRKNVLLTHDAAQVCVLDDDDVVCVGAEPHLPPPRRPGLGADVPHAGQLAQNLGNR